jgi:glyoxylase I family protein
VKKITVQRLHHNAYPVRNHETTRRFYEDILELPLVAAWAEREHVLGRERVFMHVFYELADGSALAFFQVATPLDDTLNRAQRTTPMDHIAFSVDSASQAEIKERLEANGFPAGIIDHGYVKSLYTVDPDGLHLEFTVDPPDVTNIAASKRKIAHAELKRWLDGDYTTNNNFRSDVHDELVPFGTSPSPP